jgi:hypothetical protein
VACHYTNWAIPTLYSGQVWTKLKCHNTFSKDPLNSYFLKIHEVVPEMKHVTGWVGRHDIPSMPSFYTMYKHNNFFLQWSLISYKVSSRSAFLCFPIFFCKSERQPTFLTVSKSSSLYVLYVIIHTLPIYKLQIQQFTKKIVLKLCSIHTKESLTYICYGISCLQWSFQQKSNPHQGTLALCQII